MARKGDTPKEARFRALVREMLEQGIKPTPMNIRRRQGNEKFVNPPVYAHRGPTLSGSLSTIRIEEFKRAGWTQEVPGGTWSHGS